MDKDAKTSGVVDNDGKTIKETWMTTIHARLSQFAKIIVHGAYLTIEGTNLKLNELKLIYWKFEEMNGKQSIKFDLIGKRSSKEPKSIYNPSHVRSKG